MINMMPSANISQQGRGWVHPLIALYGSLLFCGVLGVLVSSGIENYLISKNDSHPLINFSCKYILNDQKIFFWGRIKAYDLMWVWFVIILIVAVKAYVLLIQVVDKDFYCDVVKVYQHCQQISPLLLFCHSKDQGQESRCRAWWRLDDQNLLAEH